VWLYLNYKTRVLNAKQDFLWLSPKFQLGSKFKQLNNLTYSELTFSALYETKETSVRFESNSYDVAICFETITNNENDFHALVRLFHIMKPGGWTILYAQISQLTNAGFIVHPIELSSFISEDLAVHYGVSSESVLNVCVKPDSISWVDKKYALNSICQEKSPVNERVYVSAKFY